MFPGPPGLPGREGKVGEAGRQGVPVSSTTESPHVITPAGRGEEGVSGDGGFDSQTEGSGVGPPCPQSTFRPHYALTPDLFIDDKYKYINMCKNTLLNMNT